MVRYWHHHGRTRFAREPIRYALAHVSEQLPKVTVAEFDRGRQRRFMAALAAAGQKPATVSRYMGVIAAALNRATSSGELASSPPIEKPEVVQSRGVEAFSLAELRQLLAAARTDNERLLTLIWTATCCRPGAALDLTWDRVDFDSHTIDFRVPGRRVTKKRRTLPPMAPSLENYLEARRSTGFVVAWKTKRRVAPLKSFKVLMRRLALRAGVNGTAYRIRKAVATWLRAQAVPEGEIQALLGHRFGASETERYARPEYLSAARAALERLLREVAPPWLPVAPAAANDSGIDLPRFAGAAAANDEAIA